MISAVVLPATFPLVGLGLASTLVLTLVQGSTAMKHRKSAKVDYPNLYASEDAVAKNPGAFKYNCAQRAHQNTVESVGQILALTLFLGLINPVAATSYNLLWVAGRFLYGFNYVNYGPAGRNNGLAKIAYIGLFGLFFHSIYYAGLAAYRLAL